MSSHISDESLSSIQEKGTGASSKDEPPHNEKSLGETTEGHQYMSGAKLNILVAGLALSILLVALDNSILATAIPTITTRFNSIEDVGWYCSVFPIAVTYSQYCSWLFYARLPEPPKLPGLHD
jgi:hypothetical protein